MSAKVGRRINLFGLNYEWVRRTGTKSKSPKRTTGQLLLRRYRGAEDLKGDWQPSQMPMWVPPCAVLLDRPIPYLIP